MSDSGNLTIGLAYFHSAMALYRRGKFARAIEVLEKGAKCVPFPGWAEMRISRMSQARLRPGIAFRRLGPSARIAPSTFL